MDLYLYRCAADAFAPGVRAGIAEVLKTFILFDAEYYRKAVDYFARMEAHLRKAGTCCGGECVYGQEELTEIIRKRRYTSVP